MTIHNILIIEDDRALSEGLCRALICESVQTESCSTIEKARNRLASNKFDLIILDVNLPDGNGFDFLKELKEKYQVPVILLTVNDLESDIVSGLEAGAEDYITKPFSLAVLRARVNTQLRRIQQKNETADSERIGPWLFDWNRLEFFYQGENVELSRSEQRLLHKLLQNKGVILPRQTLIDSIWGADEYIDENALSVCVKRLRDKLHTDCIKTIYGIGYVWRSTDD